MKQVEYEHTPHNFLGLDPEDCSLETSRNVVLPIPYDRTASYGVGARNGPAAIIAASGQVEWYDMRLDCQPHKSGIATLPPLTPSAAGPEQMCAQIRSCAAGLLDEEKMLVGLGGDHSVTIGLAQAHSERWPEIGFVQLDAHADLRDSYQGSRYSHACTARRLNEIGPLLQLGIRSACKEELELDLPTPHPLITLQARELLQGRDWSVELDRLPEQIYLTIDVDVLDPAIMPSTGTPEPGGLGYYQTLEILERLFDSKRIVGMDLVELAPISGISGPDVICAHLVQTAIGLRWRSLLRENR
ncbi:MAG: agmatinase [Candidatus Alcyoniella australis]|nr:agmatinase [Candidatus Alcyoniella australis]